jgi:hypothetical protein
VSESRRHRMLSRAARLPHDMRAATARYCNRPGLALDSSDPSVGSWSDAMLAEHVEPVLVLFTPGTLVDDVANPPILRPVP